MSDTARDYQTIPAATTDGMDDLFRAQVPIDVDQCPAPVLTSANQCHEPVPVEIAAELLGLSINALKKQLRKGTIAGFKQDTKHGSKWFIEPSALPLQATNSQSVVFEFNAESAPVPTDADDFPAPVLTRANQCLEPVPTDADGCQQNIIPISVDKTSVADNLPTGQLLELLDRQAKELQGAYWRNGRLENQVEELQKVVQFQQQQLTEHMKLLTDSQHKKGWWAKFATWFLRPQ